MTKVVLKVYFQTVNPRCFVFKIDSETDAPPGYSLYVSSPPSESVLSTTGWNFAGSNQAVCYVATGSYIPVVVCLGNYSDTGGSQHFLNYFDGTEWKTLRGNSVGGSSNPTTITAYIPDGGGTVTAAYGNKSKALTRGSMLTLQCQGKVMATDVVISNT